MQLWLSVTEADILFADRPFSDSWFQTDHSLKITLLNWAQLFLESIMSWSDNAFITDTNGNIQARPELKAALCEQAVWFLQRNSIELPEFLQQGIESLSIGNLSAKFSTNGSDQYISPLALKLIGKYGSVQSIKTNNGSIQATLLEM